MFVVYVFIYTHDYDNGNDDVQKVPHLILVIFFSSLYAVFVVVVGEKKNLNCLPSETLYEI